MKEKIVILLALFVILAGCKKEESISTLAIPASTVFVTFRGANTFVTPDQQPMRVAMLAGENGYEHLPQLVIPDDVVTQNAEPVIDYLKRITNGDVSCGTGECVIKVKKPFTVEILDESNNAPSGGTVDQDVTYLQLVPHLKTLDPNFAMLDDDFANTVPTGSDIVAFLNVNGGKLSAAPYCGYIQVKQADNSFKPEKWASLVFLTATSENKKLKLRIYEGPPNSIQTNDITFADSRFIDVKFDNEPANSAGAHFHLHKKNAKVNNSVTFPDLDYTKACDQPQGIPIGCGSSSWP